MRRCREIRLERANAQMTRIEFEHIDEPSLPPPSLIDHIATIDHFDALSIAYMSGLLLSLLLFAWSLRKFRRAVERRRAQLLVDSISEQRKYQ